MGKVHGGANTQVMKMLLGISKMDNVDKWVTGRLEHGDRIMGMIILNFQNFVHFFSKIQDYAARQRLP